MTRILIALAFGAVLAAQGYDGRPGFGASYGPGYGADRVIRTDSRNFAERIARGERMGLITPREASRLWAMEREFRFETARASRSGFGVSHRERERLMEMSVRLDAAISREMRDGEQARRGGRW